MRTPGWALLGFLLTAAGCGGDSLGTPDPAADRDLDGVPDSEDCAPDDASRWRLGLVYRDVDGDGVGAGAPVSRCIGLLPPPGYAAAGGDCAPDDPSAWQLQGGLYLDADGDGVGAGPSLSVCIGAATPGGYAAVDGDCAPDDPDAWGELAYLYRDADLDGITVAEAGLVCGGWQLPPGYLLEANGNDCDDADAARWLQVDLYVDADGDGHGAGPATATCIGALPPHTATSGGDCDDGDASAWQLLDYAHVDLDHDGVTRPQAGQVCAGWWLPNGYSAFPAGGGADCDDADPARWQTLTGYADTDGDGHGTGPALALCTGTALPVGYAAVGDDCAPDDPLAWRLFSYAYRDADGDGYTVAESGQLCIGATVPTGYGNAPRGNDCDDSNPAVWSPRYGYADADGDGVGAGAAQAFCATALPAGFSATGTDCAPDDPSRWQTLSYAGVDADGDGYTVGPAGKVCAGATLPDPYRAAAHGNDCDDQDVARWAWTVLYPDRDGDGVGAPPREVQCLGSTIPPGYSIFGWDTDDTDPGTTWDPAAELGLVLRQP